MLYGHKTNGPIAGPLKDLLRSKGFTSSDISSIQDDLMSSTRIELSGDWFRRLGHWHHAIMEYQKAARLEEYSFGRDNSDLAFLWRKTACLAALQPGALAMDNTSASGRRRKDNTDATTPSSTVVNFDLADRVGDQWIEQAKQSLSSEVSVFIRRGDHYYGLFLYSRAVGEYCKASSAALTSIRTNILLFDETSLRPKRRKSGKSRPNDDGNIVERNVPTTGEISKDLRDFLKGVNETESRPPFSADLLSISLHSLLEQSRDSIFTGSDVDRFENFGSRKMAIKPKVKPSLVRRLTVRLRPRPKRKRKGPKRPSRMQTTVRSSRRRAGRERPRYKSSCRSRSGCQSIKKPRTYQGSIG